jgi:peptidoglycan-N-acetylglucosamine deacetylase
LVPHESEAPMKGIPISITFDDGPHPTRTVAILDILQERKIPATFFVLGQRIDRGAGIVQRMVSEGHTVGNHSFSHPDFSRIETPRLAIEVIATDVKIWLASGTWPRYFRFPYGQIDARIRSVSMEHIIAWDVDAYDWKVKNPHTLATKILAQVHTGSIILLHDIKEDTVRALPEILDTLLARGYRFISLDELIGSTPHERDDIIYNASRSRRLPERMRNADTIYHPRGTEASEETLRW